ncbi:hypothetical protein [Pseudodesulfovibrio karagichevae]|uniref:Right handed beta helix domain-containing protein n=1 Tax=Pseudodesulfovibrio karagichevae TaxID=3239305 RepID=A0ABV4K166_9BACT
MTLNLNGHTLTYNEKQADGVGVAFSKWNMRDIVLINGTIRQGSAGGNGNAYGRGANPVRTKSFRGAEFAGLTLVYHGADLSGVHVAEHGDDLDFHHNTVVDEGTSVTNRHAGVAAVYLAGENPKVRHNRIINARQLGIRCHRSTNCDVHNNEITLDSRVANSTAISIPNGIAHHNKVIGRGVNPTGIWPGVGVKVYSNYVDVQNTRTGKEYVSPGACCVRFGLADWTYSDKLEFYGNTFIVRAEAGVFSAISRKHLESDSWGRALFVGLGKGQKAVFHHNIIVGVNKGHGGKCAAVAVVFSNESPDLIFENNVIASSWGNILLGDLYSWSNGFPLFKKNTIIRLEGSENYHTIRSEYKEFISTARFLDNEYLDGASKDDFDYDNISLPLKELAYCRTLSVQAPCSGQGDNEYVLSMRDQRGEDVWSSPLVCGDWTDFIVPERLLTNYLKGKGPQRKLYDMAPDGWELVLRHGQEERKYPLPGPEVHQFTLGAE